MSSDDHQAEHSDNEDVVTLPEWGKQLRSLRESRGMSALDIAHELYLDVALIEALENEDTANLPASSFIKGYLRNYARALDEPCEDIIKAFECVCNGEDSSPCIQRISKVKETTSKDIGPRYATWGLVAVGLVLLGVWWWAEVLPSSAERKPDTVVDNIAPVPFDEQVDELQADIQVDGESMPAVALMAADADAKPVVDELEPVDALDDVVDAEVAENTQRLRLVFTQDSWVSIKDAAGERLFYDMGKEGQQSDIVGVAPFKILLGNAPGVVLELNDERIDHVSFQRNGVARFNLGE